MVLRKLTLVHTLIKLTLMFYCNKKHGNIVQNSWENCYKLIPRLTKILGDVQSKKRDFMQNAQTLVTLKTVIIFIAKNFRL